MRLYINIIFPIFVAISSYSLLTFFFGESGVYSHKKLEDERNNIIKNIEDIKQKGVELDVLIKNLTSDEETIRIFAHDLGYVADGEIIVKLPSFKPDVLSDINYGTALEVHRTSFISDSLCKKFSTLMGLIAFIIEILITRSYDYKEERKRVYSYSS